jgi:hypothetical protein
MTKMSAKRKTKIITITITDNIITPNIIIIEILWMKKDRISRAHHLKSTGLEILFFISIRSDLAIHEDTPRTLRHRHLTHHHHQQTNVNVSAMSQPLLFIIMARILLLKIAKFDRILEVHDHEVEVYQRTMQLIITMDSLLLVIDNSHNNKSNGCIMKHVPVSTMMTMTVTMKTYSKYDTVTIHHYVKDLRQVSLTHLN